MDSERSRPKEKAGTVHAGEAVKAKRTGLSLAASRETSLKRAAASLTRASE